MNTGVPGAADTAVFSANYQISSTVDPLFGDTVERVKIENGYNQALSLQKDLIVKFTELRSGKINGSFAYNVPTDGVFDFWKGELQGGGSSLYAVNIASGGKMNLRGEDSKIFDGRTINNSGEIHWIGPGAISLEGATIKNLPGSLFSSETTPPAGASTTDVTDLGGSLLSFENATLRKPSGNSNQFLVATSFVASTIDMQMDQSKVMSFSNVSLYGTDISAVEGGQVSFNGVVTLGGATFNGPGRLDFNQATVSHAGEFNVESGTVWIVRNSILSGSGDTTVVGGTVRWVSGTMAGSGVILVGPDGTLDISDNGLEEETTATLQRTLRNQGSVLWKGTTTIDLGGGSIVNESGGVFDIQTDEDILGAGATITNSGTFKKTLGFGVATIQPAFTNEGALELYSGQIRFRQHASQWAGETKLLGGGLWVDGTFTVGDTSSLTGSGVVYAQEVLNSGTITISSDGQGALRIRQIGGQGGKFTQTAGGTLNMLIAGDNLFDLLLIDGEVSLAGAWVVNLFGSYAPNEAIVYNLISFASRPGNSEFTSVSPPADCIADYTNTTAVIERPVVLSSIGNQQVDEDAELTFNAVATPSSNITFSLVDAPTDASINTSTGVFSWTPTETQGGTSYSFTVRATHVASGLFAEETINVVVNEVNSAPVLDAFGNKEVDEGALLTFTATATDPDLPANQLTFSLIDAPEGASIDPDTGIFTWTPSATQSGTYYITIRVTDGGGLFDEEIITVIVNDVL